MVIYEVSTARRGNDEIYDQLPTAAVANANSAFESIGWDEWVGGSLAWLLHKKCNCFAFIGHHVVKCLRRWVVASVFCCRTPTIPHNGSTIDSLALSIYEMAIIMEPTVTWLHCYRIAHYPNARLHSISFRRTNDSACYVHFKMERSLSSLLLLRFFFFSISYSVVTIWIKLYGTRSTGEPSFHSERIK